MQRQVLSEGIFSLRYIHGHIVNVFKKVEKILTKHISSIDWLMDGVLRRIGNIPAVIYSHVYIYTCNGGSKYTLYESRDTENLV